VYFGQRWFCSAKSPAKVMRGWFSRNNGSLHEFIKVFSFA
jgi:hypothetical protein